MDIQATAETQRSVAAMKLLVDPKVGIVQSVSFVKLFEDEPPVFLCYARPAAVLPIAGIEGANQGGACAVSAERAFLRGCGEAVERYCSSFIPENRIIQKSTTELASDGARFAPLTEFYSFASWQYTDEFPFDRPDEERAVRWVKGSYVQSGGKVLVPASCVYVPYRFNRHVEPFSHMPISTGLACGPSYAFALEKATLEILERDALMIVWHKKLPTVKITLDERKTHSHEIEILLSAARSGTAKWHLNLLTLDVPIPVVSAILIDSEGPPKTSFGVAADLDPLKAVVRAMEEALLSRLLLNRTDLVEAKRSASRSPRTLRQHLAAHAVLPELRSSLFFLINAERTEPLDEFVSHWSKLQTSSSIFERLETASLQAIAVDVTTPDVRDLGFFVVRVLIPGAQPLDNDHCYPYLGGKRLASVPVHLGNVGQLNMWNSDPHPFP